MNHNVTWDLPKGLVHLLGFTAFVLGVMESTLHMELIPSHPCSLAVFGKLIPGALGY